MIPWIAQNTSHPPPYKITGPQSGPIVQQLDDCIINNAPLHFVDLAPLDTTTKTKEDGNTNNAPFHLVDLAPLDTTTETQEDNIINNAPLHLVYLHPHPLELDPADTVSNDHISTNIIRTQAEEEPDSDWVEKICDRPSHELETGHLVNFLKSSN